ncbi:MAG: hydroxyisourate hydrolase [Planctomycetota bacterium]
MSPITTHALDTALGQPAKGLAVRLEFIEDGQAKQLAAGVTNDDGRVGDLLSADAGGIRPGTYRLHFETRAYFESTGRETFYPAVTVEFSLTDSSQHYHVPLLISPFGYSTYRGS